MSIRRALLAFALTFVGPLAEAASFDCDKATTYVEKTVCADPLLNRLDDVLARNYQAMLGADLGATRQSLRAEQFRWLAARNRCGNVKCLVDAYSARVDETCDYGVISGVHPECTPAREALAGAGTFAQGQLSVLKELQLRKGQDYSAARLQLVGAGWKPDAAYVTDAGQEGSKPYGFEDVVCGTGRMAVCSARFLRGKREIMLVLRPGERLVLDGAWDDK